MTEPSDRPDHADHPDHTDHTDHTDHPGQPDPTKSPTGSPTGNPTEGPAPRRAPDWIARFAHALGLDPPDDAAIEQLLDLAGVAAHASERVAAPIACYLVGRAGADLETAMRAAQQVAEVAEVADR